MDLSGLSQVDKSVQELEALWGKRPEWRRNYGNANRTHLGLWLRSIADEAKTFGADCELPELDTMAQFLLEAWPGEEAFDTIKLIDAIAAAKSKPPAMIKALNPDGFTNGKGGA